MLVPSARGSRSQTRGSSAGRTIEGGRMKRDALMAGLILLVGSCDAFIFPLGVTRLRLGSQNCCAFGDGRQRVDPSTTGLSQGRQRGMGAGIGALQMAKGGDKEPAEERKSVEELKELMDKMLQDQYRYATSKSAAGPIISGQPPPVDQDDSPPFGGKRGPKHVVGGFSVVLRVPDEGIAYRLQPMETHKAGMTWVAFHDMVATRSEDDQLLERALMSEALFTPDRSLILSNGRSTTKRSWEQSEIAVNFQYERLRESTRKLVETRRRVTAEGRAFKNGECHSSLSCPIEPTEGGVFDNGGVKGGILIPTHWFWYEVGRPEFDEGVVEGDLVITMPGASTAAKAGLVKANAGSSAQAKGSGSAAKGAKGGLSLAQSAGGVREHGTFDTSGKPADAVAPVRRRRMKGIELSDALLLPRQAGASRGANGPPPVPLRVEAKSVSILTSVFPHAQGDVGGLNKRLWAGGAADNVTVVVLSSVQKGLITMHAMGMPHGDLKPANILYSGGQFCLTDMPALNWTATPVLTKDPVAHTMIRGKRFMCNDMWGLGMVCLGLVCGHSKFESIKTSMRQFDMSKLPQPLGKMDAVTSHWLVVILILLSEMDSVAPPLSEDTARAARRALRSEWLGKQVPATRFKAYMNRCSGVSNELRETLLRPGRRQDLIEALIYCLDVTDVSRNALAMPHVDTTSEP